MHSNKSRWHHLQAAKRIFWHAHDESVRMSTRAHKNTSTQMHTCNRVYRQHTTRRFTQVCKPQKGSPRCVKSKNSTRTNAHKQRTHTCAQAYVHAHTHTHTHTHKHTHCNDTYPYRLASAVSKTELCLFTFSACQSIGICIVTAPIPKCRKNQQLVVLKSTFGPVYYILEVSGSWSGLVVR